ncbi:unnamed protein product [Orchesella dallaii]|uniref:Uncharacterized protein n=1 Tax=Orchesella dallaii TaxID=48710 RepID=A0ABP1RM93_9HEXA
MISVRQNLCFCIILAIALNSSFVDSSKYLLTPAEKVFLAFIPQCTIYFSRSQEDNIGFQRFVELCTFPKFNQPQPCVTLHSKTPTTSFQHYGFPPGSFSLHKNLLYNNSMTEDYYRRSSVGRMVSTKHFTKCFLYLSNLYDPFVNGSPTVASLLERIQSFEAGRIFPDYLLLLINASVNSPDFLYYKTSYISSPIFARRSKVLVTDESEGKIYMFCQPCGFKILKAENEADNTYDQKQHNEQPLNLVGSRGHSSSIVPGNEEDTVRIGSLIDLEQHFGFLNNVGENEIKILWTKLHRSLENFGRDIKDDEANNYWHNFSDTSLLNICGGFGIGILEYIRKIDDNIFYERGKSDPQESCLYKIVFETHNFSGIRSNENINTLPFQLLTYKQVVGHHHESVHVYFPDGARIQGFQYSIFVDNSLISSEFDLVALTRPFEATVWITLLGAILFLAFIVKIMGGKFNSLLQIFAILLEQDVVLKIRKNGNVCLVLGVWMLATILLRFAYTGTMYSFLSSLTYPKVPSSLESLVNRHLDKYGVFVGQGESEVLGQYVLAKLQEIEKNGTEIKFLSNFKRAYKTLYEHDLQRLWLSQVSGNESEMDPFEETFGLNRFAFISLTHPTKAFSSYNFYPGGINGQGGSGGAGGGGGYEGNDHSGNGGSQKMLPPQWEPPIPFESALIATGKYLHFRSDNTSMNPSVWLFHGHHDYFTQYFCHDLSSLIQAGIYLKWEQLMNAHIEKKYIEKLNLKMGTHFSSLSSTERHASLLTFQQVNNYSLRVIWTLYYGGLVLGFLAYAREIIRLNLPKRPKTMFLP